YRSRPDCALNTDDLVNTATTTNQSETASYRKKKSKVVPMPAVAAATDKNKGTRLVKHQEPVAVVAATGFRVLVGQENRPNKDKQEQQELVCLGLLSRMNKRAAPGQAVRNNLG